MLEIKGYITNLGKYNEGELVGEWVTFPLDDEEVKEVFERIGINEEYEEYFFTDWETDFDNDFGEYESIRNINELAEKLADWDSDTFESACDVWTMSEVLENGPDNYILLSDVNDDYDLGYYYAVEYFCIDFLNNPILENYFDFDSYGRDIRFEVNGGHTGNGWIEYMG